MFSDIWTERDTAESACKDLLSMLLWQWRHGHHVPLGAWHTAGLPAEGGSQGRESPWGNQTLAVSCPWSICPFCENCVAPM
jgi:hypothetical protein